MTTNIVDGFLDDPLGRACPRRLESGATRSLPDKWIKSRGYRSCTYCGSAHPDDVMAAIREDRVVLGPTDKNYKLYLEGADVGFKFYLQHLSAEQRSEFVDLYNDRELRQFGDDMAFTVVTPGLMKFSYPGYLYAGAFFMRTAR